LKSAIICHHPPRALKPSHGTVMVLLRDEAAPTIDDKAGGDNRRINWIRVLDQVGALTATSRKLRKSRFFFLFFFFFWPLGDFFP